MFKKICTSLLIALMAITGYVGSVRAETLTSDKTITVQSLSNLVGKVGESFNSSFQATGGQLPYGFQVTTGTLPPGLSLRTGNCTADACTDVINNKASITGTPSAAGNYSFTLTATDGTGKTGSGQFLISITGDTKPPGVSGITYNTATDKSTYTSGETIAITISATNTGTASQTLQFNTGCQASYEIVGAFSYNRYQACTQVITQVTLKPTESKTWQFSHDLNKYPVNPGSYQVNGIVLGYGQSRTPITIISKSSPVLIVSSPKRGDVLQVGNTYDINWSGSSQATNANVTITLSKPLPPCATATPACEIAFQSFNITASAPNSGNYKWAVPTSLPQQFFGDVQIRVAVNDSGVAGVSDVFSIKAPQNQTDKITVSQGSSSLNGTVGQAYGAIFRASGGMLPYTFAIKSGHLPTGVTLTTTNCDNKTLTTDFVCTPDTAVLSGIPTESGNFTFEIAAADINGLRGSGAFTAVIAPGSGQSLQVTTDSGLSAQLGQSFSAVFSAKNSQGSVTYSLSKGQLPPGLTLGQLIPECAPPAAGLDISPASCGPVNQGLVTGTPTKTGIFEFELTAKDSQNNTGKNNFRITVSGGTQSAVTIKTDSGLTGKTGQVFSATFRASGGKAPMSFSISSGTLPAGLQLTPLILECNPQAGTTNNTCGENRTVTITGTPTAVGISTFTLTAKDVNGLSGSQSFTITILDTNQTILNITTNANLTAVQGESFNAEFKVTGGKSPYQWQVISGKLPTGLSLVIPPQPLSASCPIPNCGNFQNNTINIQGVTTESGSYTFTLSASDTDKNIGTGSFTITVNPKQNPGQTGGGDISKLVPGTSNFKLANNPTIYFYTKDSTKQAYTSMAMLKAWKVDTKSIIILSAGTQLPPDDQLHPNVQLPEGVLVKGSKPQVYLVENSKLRPFASLKAFSSKGYKLNQVIVFPDSELKGYEVGEAIN